MAILKKLLYLINKLMSCTVGTKIRPGSVRYGTDTNTAFVEKLVKGVSVSSTVPGYGTVPTYTTLHIQYRTVTVPISYGTSLPSYTDTILANLAPASFPMACVRFSTLFSFIELQFNASENSFIDCGPGTVRTRYLPT